jgi:hypothetical protein
MRPALRTMLAPALALGFWLSTGTKDACAGEGAPPAGGRSFFERFDLPDAWEARFWEEADARALLEMEPKDVAALVPVQAGLRYCRCPSCDASEREETLDWTLKQPDKVTCRRCGASFPSDTIPAKVNNAVPEEVVEVRPRTLHRYPYHNVEPARQRYADERLYLAARRDYQKREFLAKAALYAAVSHRNQPDPRRARLACVLVLRFAQVYPAYAIHFDQPGQPKLLQPAEMRPPFRRAYQTAKWDWSGCLDVPLNLVIAYALVRDDPALAEAGQLLGDPRPAETIERGFFRAAALFVAAQPEEYSEASLYAYRGMLAVGRLLEDDALINEATARLDAFSRRAFYHDGLWREGDTAGHRRVLHLIDGWIGRLLDGDPSRLSTAFPMLALARGADAVIAPVRVDDIQLARWPFVSPATSQVRRPALLGGAGLARLAVGEANNALDLELRGLGDGGGGPSARLAIRLWVGGRSLLADHDDGPPSPDGFDRATASHNTVLIDGLNQRESPELARQGAPGASLRFFAADRDFQAALFDDPRAYPHASSVYRHLIAASAGTRTRYMVSVFEVEGGLQHDQMFHAAGGTAPRWELSRATAAGPPSLLAPSVVYLPHARAEEGRWFIQAPGAIQDLRHALLDRPSQATLRGSEHSLRLHLLGDVPALAVEGRGPASAGEDRRACLVVRRSSNDGSTLTSRYVTLFEPLGSAFEPLRRVGRIESPPGTVVLLVESTEGVEHLILNLQPGREQSIRLSDNRVVKTDGLAIRVRDDGIALAGGSFAEHGDRRLTLPPIHGTIRAVDAREGRFVTDTGLPRDPTLIGRVLHVRHGDGIQRGWTIAGIEPFEGGTRIAVRETPGFHIDSQSGEAVYDQFPGTRHPGPHAFGIGRIAR